MASLLLIAALVALLPLPPLSTTIVNLSRSFFDRLLLPRFSAAPLAPQKGYLQVSSAVPADAPVVAEDHAGGGW